MTAATVAAGCGSGSDDSSDSETDAPAPVSEPVEAPAATDPPALPAATQPPETTAAPPATAAPTTTEAATTTTVDPLGEARTQAEALAGPYTGSWTNTTFGSTGPMVMNIAVDGDDVVVDVDLGGFVFGQSDPEPESYRFPLAAIAGSGAIETAVFGSATIEVDDATGTITMLADAVPAPGIARFESTVNQTGNGVFEGTYVVVFDDGGTAEGTIDFRRG